MSDEDIKDESVKQMDQSTGDGSEAAGGSGPGSKNYKTTLCQFYLQGPCKNGESCNYAHGTSELRTPTGKVVKDVEERMAGEKKIKTRLCEKFLAYGHCPFGDGCTYAHGVRELQKAVSVLNPDHANPSFKTSLCRHVPIIK